jgi:hypothetical protein
MKSTVLLLMLLLLPSCGLSGWGKDSLESANNSALFDPPTVTLLPNKVYQFKEGTLSGRGQKFHSDYSYRRALIIGNQ